MRLILFALSCCLMPLHSVFAQSNQKPKVIILTTGGTIASRTDAPLIEGPALVQAVPQLADYADVQVEEVVRIGSSQMTPATWLRILLRIDELARAKPDLACIVITHGTDTMEETAFFLNLTHRHDLPVVITGSMRSANALSADGPANLVDALRAGIAPGARGKGVLVVLNDNIHAARDLTKSDNQRVQTFLPTERGYLGFVDDEQVTFYRTPVHPHTIDSPFDVVNAAGLPEVDILKDFAGLDPAIFDFFRERPTDGLVLETFAGGRSSAALRSATDLPEEHKPVVIASSLRGSRIMGTHPAGTPVIIANDLPANKARILLMLALTQTKEMEEIQEFFNTY